MKIPWNYKFLEEVYNSEVEQADNSSIYSKSKNCSEKEITHLSRAIRDISDQIDLFFENNHIHKFYLEKTTFYDVTKDNDRFCRFCYLKKVLFL